MREIYTQQQSPPHKKLFIKLPIEFIDAGWPRLLRKKEYDVYLALKRFENSKRHDCFPSYKVISDIAGVNGSNIRHIIDKLILFWLIRELPSTEKDPHKYNKYYICQHIYKPTVEQLGELRQLAKQIQIRRAEKWKKRRKQIPRRFTTRLAQASPKIKAILGPVMQGIAQRTKPA